MEWIRSVVWVEETLPWMVNVSPRQRGHKPTRPVREVAHRTIQGLDNVLHLRILIQEIYGAALDDMCNRSR